jgi:hypothetical protein
MFSSRHDRSIRELAHADTQTDGKKLAAEAARRPARPLPLRMRPFPLNIGIRCSRILEPGTASNVTTKAVEIQRHVLRVSCRRCERTVEIQTVDAVRLFGGNAIWKEVAQRLLDGTCQQRTGRHEEDGCWPALEKPQ